MTYRMFGLCLALTMLPLSPNFADQNDPELDTLFRKLQITQSQAEAQGITNRIWTLWREHEDDAVTELMALGMRSVRVADLDGAIDYFSQVIRLAPEFAEGWNARATTYYNMGEYALSTSDVRVTLNLEPRHFGALSGQGMIYMQQDNPDDAVVFFERALEMNPHMYHLVPTIQRLNKIIKERVI